MLKEIKDRAASGCLIGPEEDRDWLIAKVESLQDALVDLLRLFSEPGESANDTFERVAELYRLSTGHLRPGKSYPMECHVPPMADQLAAYTEWVEGLKSQATEALEESEC